MGCMHIILYVRECRGVIECVSGRQDDATSLSCVSEVEGATWLTIQLRRWQDAIPYFYLTSTPFPSPPHTHRHTLHPSVLLAFHLVLSFSSSTRFVSVFLPLTCPHSTSLPFFFHVNCWSTTDRQVAGRCVFVCVCVILWGTPLWSLNGSQPMAPRCTLMMKLISHLTATDSPDRHFRSRMRPPCVSACFCLARKVFVCVCVERVKGVSDSDEAGVAVCCVVCGWALIMIVNGGLPRWHLLSLSLSLPLLLTMHAPLLKSGER